MTNTLKYYLNTLNELEYGKFLADQSWLTELKNQNTSGCKLMLNSALDNVTISIIKGDSSKQFMGILVLVAL